VNPRRYSSLLVVTGSTNSASSPHDSEWKKQALLENFCWTVSEICGYRDSYWEGWCLVPNNRIFLNNLLRAWTALNLINMSDCNSLYHIHQKLGNDFQYISMQFRTLAENEVDRESKGLTIIEC